MKIIACRICYEPVYVFDAEDGVCGRCQAEAKRKYEFRRGIFGHDDPPMSKAQKMWQDWWEKNRPRGEKG